MNPLKKYRALRGLSLRELAEKAGVDQKSISLVENDHRKAQLKTLGKLAAALDAPLDEFLELQDTTAPERGRKGVSIRLGKLVAVA